MFDLKKFFPLALLLSFAPFILHAQAWSGILNPTRAASWSLATVGVSGGIPSASWTQCGRSIAAYGTSASPGNPARIQDAIDACRPNHYVLLGPGTFWLNGGLTISQSKVVLRGSGPQSTTLKFTAGVACISGNQDICVLNENHYFPSGLNTLPPCGGSGSANCFNWTGGYGQGATSITVANVGSTGISKGDIIVLDQADDGTDNGGEIICSSNASFICFFKTQNPTNSGRKIGGVFYSQEQFVRVTAGCSSTCAGAGPFTLTISPGLYANNWNGTGAVGGFFVKPLTMVGVENLTIDNTNNTRFTSSIGEFNVDGFWVKNIVSIEGNRNHIWTLDVSHGEIRDNYFFGTQHGLTESYGVELANAGDSLVENNIFQQVASPLIGPGSATGNVYGYNFWINDYYTGASGLFMQDGYMSHDAGNSFNLYEGNQGNALTCDIIHGSSALDTVFRNWLDGRDYNTAGGAGSRPTEQTYPIDLDAHCRGYNIIGNVLGTPGYHTRYQYSAGETPTRAQCNLVIYELGFGGGVCSTLGSEGVADDRAVAATLMRWGNYDVSTGAVRWDSSESSPGAVTHIAAQATPASHSLPASFYYSSKPSFWGSMPWPAIGPDVTGGTGPGGFAYRNPAAACYYTTLSGPTDGGGNPLPFDANNCYPSSTTSKSLPSPPR